MKLRLWISALRLRTLPLALASIGMGSFLAAAEGSFKWTVLGMAAITTVSLQILSNLSNDYGDSVHGADSSHREGPVRAVQSGAISPAEMKTAMGVFVGLSFLCGLVLLYVALGWNLPLFLSFVILGLIAILAALTYTSGNSPYGYQGLGDLSVLLFFGLLGVVGTFFLHTGDFDYRLLLPAFSCGLFSVAVLNINNIRDISADLKAGKRTIPVRIGRSKAIGYHWFLLSTGFLLALWFVLMDYHSASQFTFFLSLPLLVQNGLAISKIETPSKLDPYLKQMVLTTLLFVLTFGIGLLLS